MIGRIAKAAEMGLVPAPRQGRLHGWIPVRLRRREGDGRRLPRRSVGDDVPSAALGQPVSERDLLRKKHPELYPEEIDFMLSPRNDSECPF